jgi:hypothetical protein
VCTVSYCTTTSGKCTSDNGCKCQNSAHTRFSHNSGACFSCGMNYCTAESGKCTSDAACSCQDSGHTKRTHTQSSGSKCYSCGKILDGDACSTASDIDISSTSFSFVNSRTLLRSRRFRDENLQHPVSVHAYLAPNYLMYADVRTFR